MQNEQIQLKRFDSIGRNQLEGRQCAFLGPTNNLKECNLSNLLWNDPGWSALRHT